MSSTAAGERRVTDASMLTNNQNVSRLGILGDVHGDADRLEAALASLAAMPALDALVCTGDIVNLVAETERCR